MSAFVDSRPEVGQQQYKEVADTWFISCSKPASQLLTKNYFVTSAKSTENVNQKKTVTLKESEWCQIYQLLTN